MKNKYLTSPTTFKETNIKRKKERVSKSLYSTIKFFSSSFIDAILKNSYSASNLSRLIFI